MATNTPVRPSITDAQLPELMSLLRGSDSVELKLTVPPAQQRAAIRELGLDALDAQIRQSTRSARRRRNTGPAARIFIPAV